MCGDTEENCKGIFGSIIAMFLLALIGFGIYSCASQKDHDERYILANMCEKKDIGDYTRWCYEKEVTPERTSHSIYCRTSVTREDFTLETCEQRSAREIKEKGYSVKSISVEYINGVYIGGSESDRYSRQCSCISRDAIQKVDKEGKLYWYWKSYEEKSK